MGPFGVICQARTCLVDIARHVIDTHIEPSFLELDGILRRGERYLAGPAREVRVALGVAAQVEFESKR